MIQNILLTLFHSLKLEWVDFTYKYISTGEMNGCSVGHFGGLETVGNKN